MIVYLIRNNLNGMCYVGQTSNVLEKRLKLHRHLPTKRKATALTTDIHAHGWDSFSAEVLEETDDEGADMAERFWIKAFNSLHPNGYNTEQGGAMTIDHRRDMPIGRRKKVAWETVQEIRRRRNAGEKYRVIAEDLKMPINSVYGLARGFRRLSRDVSQAGYTWDKVRSIRKENAEGASYGKLAKKYGGSRQSIGQICVNKSWVEPMNK